MRIINMGATNLHLLQELSEILKKEKSSTLPSSLTTILERVSFSMDIKEIGVWEALEVKRKATYCEIREEKVTTEYVRKSIRNAGYNPTNSSEDIFLLKNGLEWADCLEDTTSGELRDYYQNSLLLTPVCARNVSIHAVFKGSQILSIYGFNFDRFFASRSTDTSIAMAVERNLALGIHRMIGDGFAETLSKKDMITNSYLTSQVYSDMPKTELACSLARIFTVDGWCLDFTDGQRLNAAMQQEDKGNLDDVFVEFTCNTDLNTFLTFMLYQDGDRFKVTDHMDYLEMTAPKPTNGEPDYSWLSILPFSDEIKDTEIKEKYEDLGYQLREWYNKAVNGVSEEEQTMEWLFLKHLLLPGNTSIRYSVMCHITHRNPDISPIQILMSRMYKNYEASGITGCFITTHPLHVQYRNAVKILNKFWK